MQKLRTWTHVTLLLLAATGLACGIFDTRDPQPPAQTSAEFIQPSTPDIVFTNMTNAFRDRSSINYVRCFSDVAVTGRAFVFEPTSQALSRYGSILTGWTRTSEQQYFDNMRSRLPSGTAPSLVLSLSVQSFNSDSALYDATYELTIPHMQTSFPQVAKGKAQFFLISDAGGTWSIWRWIDFPDAQNSFSWSEMKGEFGQ
jgi:hypothetical protein